MAGLSKEQAEEIFLLTHKAQKLGRKLVHETSSTCPTRRHCSTWVFRLLAMQKVTSGCPDHVTAYYMMIQSEGEGMEAEKLNEAIDHLVQRGRWSMVGYKLSYSSIMLWSIRTSWATSSQRARCHWSIAWPHLDSCCEGDGGCWQTHGRWLGNHCVSGRYASYHPDTLGFPLIYTRAHWIPAGGLCCPGLSSGRMFWISLTPPPQSNQKALDVLHEEIFSTTCMVHQRWPRAVEPTVCFAMADVSTIGVKACEVGAGDGPTSSPHTCHILPASWHSRTQSQSLQHHSQSSMIQFIFLWLWFQVREHVRFQ